MIKSKLDRILTIAIEKAKTPATDEEIVIWAAYIREMDKKFGDLQNIQKLDNQFLDKTWN